MDTTELTEAYAQFAAEFEAGGFGPPPPGEWDAGRIVAHLALNDALLSAVTEDLLAGRPASFDNRPALAPEPAGVEVLRASGARFCALVERLTEDQAATVVPVFIQDGDEVAVDQPMPWGALVRAQWGYHLPRHADQLRALRPAPPG